MRGTDHQQSHMFSYLSPEARVRKDHPLRVVRTMVDEVLRALSPQFDRMYASEGRPSIAPEKLLVKGKIGKQLFIRVGYTFAKALDDGPDSLVVDRPGNVHNSYATQFERGLSVTDQRHRVVASSVYEPASFHYEQPVLNALFNNWKISTVITAGSGRPINATMAGDANRDDNSYNDRLPGAVRNAYIGPGYFTVDVRLSKGFQFGERFRLTVLAESFNLTNRVNQRVDISDDGYLNSAGQFVAYTTQVGKALYPGEFVKNSKFLIPTNSYAPRQVQLSIKASF